VCRAGVSGQFMSLCSSQPGTGSSRNVALGGLGVTTAERRARPSLNGLRDPTGRTHWHVIKFVGGLMGRVAADGAASGSKGWRPTVTPPGHVPFSRSDWVPCRGGRCSPAACDVRRPGGRGPEEMRSCSPGRRLACPTHPGPLDLGHRARDGAQSRPSGLSPPPQTIGWAAKRQQKLCMRVLVPRHVGTTTQRGYGRGTSCGARRCARSSRPAMSCADCRSNDLTVFWI
jgi:hypothetical protein